VALRPFSRLAALLALAVLVLAGPARAAGGAVAPPGPDLVTARLVAEDVTVAPGRTFWVMLKLGIKPGWHTYWRNPGDSGLATSLDWTLPPGFTAGEIVWPTPQRFQIGPVANYGYADAAELLVPMTAPADLAPGQPIALQALASWLVCADICIPGEVAVDLRLASATTSAADPSAVRLFREARAKMPQPAPFETVFSQSADAYRLRVPAAAFEGLTAVQAQFFPVDGTLIDHAAPPQSIRTAAGLELRLPKSGIAKNAPALLDGVLVVSGEGGPPRAFAIGANPGAGDTADEPAAPAVAWWHALLLALAGGIILNVMPCVFPILSLKALALARQSSQERTAARRQGRAYLAGVLTSFAVLGGLLLALRAGGFAVGWGYQFQTPAFVALLAYLMFATGLALSGLLQIGSGLANIGSRLAGRSGISGAFFTGVLATVVATPCTAPFMGTALGAALVLPAGLGMAVFLALGLGLALPLWLVSEVPALARLLPRPGAWMDTFKQLLAFPLYATAVWLLWVLLQQVDPADALAALSGLVVIAFAVWLQGVARTASAVTGRRIGGALALLALAGAVALALQASPGAASRSAKPETAAVPWETFSADRVASLNAERRPVLVNLTAAWCLTCLVNEKTAIETTAVREALATAGVTPLKGDWTRQDPAITAYLQRFGRSGVPLYVLYDRSGQPTVLPQLLTTGALVDALAQLQPKDGR
jgi:thiol:disulfide interchange protein DsbD